MITEKAKHVIKERVTELKDQNDLGSVINLMRFCLKHGDQEDIPFLTNTLINQFGLPPKGATVIMNMIEQEKIDIKVFQAP